MDNEYKNKKLIIAVIVLLCVITLSVLGLITAQFAIKQKANAVSTLGVSNVAQQNSKKCQLFQNISDVAFTKLDGTKTKISDFKGKPVVLVYWASWCPYCHTGLNDIDKLKQQAEQQGVVFYLVNKLDGKKETLEQAKKYLSDNSINAETLLDYDIKAYKEIGLSKIPTTLVINSNGEIYNIIVGKVPKAEELISMFSEVQTNKGANLSSFLLNNMLNSDGGIRTNYTHQNTATPSGDDVLSESQGLMMLSAINSNNQDLFNKLLQYAKGHTAGDSLAGWVNTKDGASKVTATVDDLRIYRALCEAQKKWGDYKDDIIAYEKALKQYVVDEDKLLDFYDFSTSQKANRLTLCYNDFEALALLSKHDKSWNKVYNNSMSIVEKGVISKDFPLYHSWYDYNTSSYKSDTLNMSEALLTLLNFSRVKKLPPDAVQWLRDRLSEGAIYALYNKDGTVAENGRYESTAVYALCALIAKSEGDEQMVSDAMLRLEKLRIYNNASNLNGAFGNEDGSGIFSFDQCMALLAYQEMEKQSK